MNNNPIKSTIIDITPKEFRCLSVACPAIYSIIGENNFAIVGKKADGKNLGLAERVGKDEEVIIVDREMLRKIFTSD